MLKSFLQISAAAAGTLFGSLLSYAPQAFAQGTLATGFVAENGNYPVSSVLFSTSSINYICSSGPGGYVGQFTDSQRLFFRSLATAPGAGLRVRIWNVSPEFGAGSAPYTDREYDKGNHSEGFDVLPGTEHQGRYFIVSANQFNTVVNSFRYEVRNNAAVVEQGQFQAQFFNKFVGTRTVFNDPVYCPFQPQLPRPWPYPGPYPSPWPY